ncbi:C40 family peptidase [Spirillospora sp. CA-108201]
MAKCAVVAADHVKGPGNGNQVKSSCSPATTRPQEPTQNWPARPPPKPNAPSHRPFGSTVTPTGTSVKSLAEPLTSPPPPPPDAAPPPSTQPLRWLGTPYSWGGRGPSGPSYGTAHGAGTKGFDRSGLTQYALAQAGIRLPRVAADQYNAGTHIRHQPPQPRHDPPRRHLLRPRPHDARPPHRRRRPYLPIHRPPLSRTPKQWACHREIMHNGLPGHMHRKPTAIAEPPSWYGREASRTAGTGTRYWAAGPRHDP